MLFCAPIIGLWYWCTDQYIVQRALGARNERRPAAAASSPRFLKLLPVFIFIIPGMICFALAEQRAERRALQQALVRRTASSSRENSQAAFPLMVQHVLPVGVRGIVVAGLLAALMSSLAGVFNASSTLFTMDLYQKFKPARLAGASWSGSAGWPPRHGADRPGLGPGDPGGTRAVRLPAGRPGLPGAADLRGVLLRRLLPPAEPQGLPGGAAGRVRARACSAWRSTRRCR